MMHFNAERNLTNMIWEIENEEFLSLIIISPFLIQSKIKNDYKTLIMY